MDALDALVNEYLCAIRNEKKICRLRNSLLTMRHKQLPSYSLWSDDDIYNESIDERKKWLFLFLEKKI